MSIDDQDYTLHKKRSEPYEPCIKPNIFGEYEEKFRELRDRIEKLEKEKGLTAMPYYPPYPYYYSPCSHNVGIMGIVGIVLTDTNLHHIIPNLITLTIIQLGVFSINAR